MILVLIIQGRHERKTVTDAHNTHVHMHSAERCWRYCTQDGRCWPKSRGGLYHFPVAFYFNTGKSSGAPTVPALPLPLAGTSAPPAAHAHGDSGWLVIYTILIQRQIPSVIIEYLYVPGSDLLSTHALLYHVMFFFCPYSA